MKKQLVALLLAVCAVRHYGWNLVPPEMAGAVSKMLGGVAVLSLLYVVWRLAKGGVLLGAVLAWWAWEESQVVVCSALFAVNPWPVEPGQSICSALAGFDFGALNVVVVALLAWQAIKSDSPTQL